MYQVYLQMGQTHHTILLRWLKIDARGKLFVDCLLYNVMHTQQPKLIYDKLIFKSAKSTRITRASDDLLILPRCRTEVFKHSFIFSTSKLWNNLPSDLRCIETIGDFKNKLHEHLLRTTLFS